MNIPKFIQDLVAQMKSQHNDGFVRKEARKRLIEIRNYINYALGN